MIKLILIFFARPDQQNCLHTESSIIIINILITYITVQKIIYVLRFIKNKNFLCSQTNQTSNKKRSLIPHQFFSQYNKLQLTHFPLFTFYPKLKNTTSFVLIHFFCHCFDKSYRKRHA